MADINSVTLTGRLTADPELRSTKGGTQVLSWRMASNGRRRNAQSGEWEDEPCFVGASLFGDRAESLARILAKGMQVAVQGRLRYSSWESDGQRHSRLDVVAREVVLPPKGSGVQAQGQPRAAAPRTQQPQEDVYAEDIPF